MNEIADLRERLESRELFEPLFNDFIKRSINEQRKEESDPGNPYNFLHSTKDLSKIMHVLILISYLNTVNLP